MVNFDEKNEEADHIESDDKISSEENNFVKKQTLSMEIDGEHNKLEKVVKKPVIEIDKNSL